MILQDTGLESKMMENQKRKFLSLFVRNILKHISSRFGFKYASGSLVNETRFGNFLSSQNYAGCVEATFYSDSESWTNVPCTNELKFICKRLSIFDEKAAPKECPGYLDNENDCKGKAKINIFESLSRLFL